MKKRILTAVLAAALVTGTCAATVSAKEEKTYTIGICQLVQHDALDAATKGFEDAITEKMGDSVKFDEQNAQGDSNTCSTIINGFVSEGGRPDPCKRNRISSGCSCRNFRYPDPRNSRYRVRCRSWDR